MSDKILESEGSSIALSLAQPYMQYQPRCSNCNAKVEGIIAVIASHPRLEAANVSIFTSKLTFSYLDISATPENVQLSR